MDRRAFLRMCGLGAVVLGPGALGACAPRGGTSSAASPSPSAGDAASPTLSVHQASFEMLTGSGRRFVFGLTNLDNEPVVDRAVEVYVSKADGGTRRGPHPAEFHEGVGPLGLYLTVLDLPEPGYITVDVVAGDDHGSANVHVVDPADSKVAVPGDPAPPTRTPTHADDMGMLRLCTEEPPCGMHDESLHDLLAQGRPAVLLFATPAYCQTAVCGPAVATVAEVRRTGDWGDAGFIHVEIFRDEGEQLSAPVEEWGLPSEPWLFTIRADGTIDDRMNGPMIPSQVREMVARATSGS